MLTKFKNLYRNLLALANDPGRQPSPPHEPKIVPATEVLTWMISRWLTAPEIRTADGRRCVMNDADKRTIQATIRFLKEIGASTQPKPAPEPGMSMEEMFAMKAAQAAIEAPIAAAKVPPAIPLPMDSPLP